MIRTFTRIAAAVALVLMAGLVAPRAAAEDAAPPKVTVTGSIDWFYQLSLNHPPAGASLTGRAFDVRSNSFTLGLAEVNVSRAATAASPLGFTATATIGKTADLTNLTEPGGAIGAGGANDTSYKLLEQVYGTWLSGGSRPITVDFGKYVTMMGMEVIESAANDNYSRGLLFTYAIPLYHAGVRVTYGLTPTLTGQLHLVNGWNNLEDDNGGKSVGVQLNWKPNDRMNWILNYMGGDEGGKALGGGINSGIGFPDALRRSTHVVDVVGVVNLTPKVKLGINGDYGGAFASGASGTWGGVALYGRYQATAKSAVALRAEHFQDAGGLRFGAAAVANSLTATYEYVVGGSLVNRIEFRHDGSGVPLFAGHTGAAKTQQTISFSQVYKF